MTPTVAEDATVQLKPCPFCGGDAHIDETVNGGTRKMYRIECAECYANSQWFFDHPDGAVEIWNRRVKG